MLTDIDRMLTDIQQELDMVAESFEQLGRVADPMTGRVPAIAAAGAYRTAARIIQQRRDPIAEQLGDVESSVFCEVCGVNWDAENPCPLPLSKQEQQR